MDPTQEIFKAVRSLGKRVQFRLEQTLYEFSMSANQFADLSFFQGKVLDKRKRGRGQASIVEGEFASAGPRKYVRLFRAALRRVFLWGRN